jgi:hypothetical protein
MSIRTDQEMAQDDDWFLPKVGLIAVTKKGRRSKVQPKMDTSARLDPFRAEVRLLQVAVEIEGKMVVLVIELCRVSLISSSWHVELLTVGHNLSFDAKMLIANGVKEGVRRTRVRRRPRTSAPVPTNFSPAKPASVFPFG